jgi:hypothetical protein
MLETYFSYRGVLRRLRGGALGGEMDRIAARFTELGYKRNVGGAANVSRPDRGRRRLIAPGCRGAV